MAYLSLFKKKELLEFFSINIVSRSMLLEKKYREVNDISRQGGEGFMYTHEHTNILYLYVFKNYRYYFYIILLLMW